jgi:hypothetical protein
VRYHRRGESGAAGRFFRGFLIGFSLLPSVIGLLVIYHVLIATKTLDDGTELTNRMARATYFWIAISQPEDGVSLYPWLKQDVKGFLGLDKPGESPEGEKQGD